MSRSRPVPWREARRSLGPLMLVFILAQLTWHVAGANDALQLHPENPHYFLWRGKPTVLITSGEHYGAVLNLDFDYRKYLETLAEAQLNLTRTFTGGAYVEPQGAFNIARNTLAPAAGRYIAPWARSEEPGYAGGGNKFDLTRWDDAYFRRLRDFVALASQLGIIVEINLFCPMYEDIQWQLSPFNTNNNVNNVGNVDRLNVYSLTQHDGLLPIQERMARKFVEELAEFDNVYYEITNEPYIRNVPREWEHHLVDVLVEAQRDHTHPKLISLNIANQSAKVQAPHPAVSILNFHYATPPDAVTMNFDLGRVIGDNETGFRGTANLPYRTEAWDFLIAGGGLFNHLDYSFAVGFEDGSFDYPATQPGGGNAEFRRQLGVLAEFLNGFDFIHMHPNDSVIKQGVPQGGSARALVQPGHAYAIYVRREASTGPFSVRWTGSVTPERSGIFTLRTSTNDGVRLWIDDRLVIDQWVDQSETEHVAQLDLVANQPYKLRMEYFYNGGQGAAKLLWSSEEMAQQAIPLRCLRTPEGEPGLRGEYFRDRELRRPWTSRTDETVDFAWGTRSPFEQSAAATEGNLTFDIPAGKYSAEWIHPTTGDTEDRVDLQHPGGHLTLRMPGFRDDIALRIKRL